MQCVPYVREHSGIKIYGDAATWWDKADGKYPRGALPQPGAVMVLHDYAGSDHGHVAVVRKVIGAREIRIDHANWLNDGAIYVNNPVEDVSGGNDWSVVRVYNLKTGGWGVKLFPVQGFIGGGDEKDRPDLVADSGGASMGATALVGEIN
jgi:surface antigen